MLAMAICAPGGDPVGESVVPCLAMVGWRQLLALQRKGARRLVVARDGCTTCHKAGDQGLEVQLALASRLWRSWQVSPIELVEVDGAAFRRLFADSEPAGSGRSRRGLIAGLLDNERRCGSGNTADTLQPFVPAIDESLCEGCDACARLCPTGALTICKEDGRLAYRIDASACSGCGLCLDVCEAGAVRLDALEFGRRGGD